MNIPDTEKKRLVIIGGGFGGVNVLRNLKKENYQIILIDQHNYHNFQPLMYQVATSGLEPDSIAFPLRGLIRGDNDTFFRMAIVEEIDVADSLVKTNIGNLKYDYLVIATGSRTNFFGNKGIEERALQMKKVPQALDIRSMMLQQFEKATIVKDISEKSKYMKIVISGAGPTGVELAGAFAEFKRGVMPDDYPDLPVQEMEIILLDGADRVLSAFSHKASEKALYYLKKLGVTVVLNTLVTDFKDNKVFLKNGDSIDTFMFIWCSGVIGNPISGFSEELIEQKSQRYKVNEYNQIMGYDNVFAIGDIALMETKDFPKGHPMVAQPAIQQGQMLVKNLNAIAQNKSLSKFTYFDKGSMATIGRNKAVADIGKYTLSGFFAWIVWLVVHLYFLIGIRNRIVVLINWSVNYFSFDRAARLIIRPYRKI